MTNPLKKYTEDQLITETYKDAAYVAEQMEMTRRLKEKIIKLDKSINIFNKTSSKQTKIMIKLTYAILGLTVIIGVLALIQILQH